ncbi:MAG TPA: CHASE3 domain-containing protein [Acetobacteraceae bacterium]|jgi:CHASE3 domain sensor protein|nr:CHASE3 domain-containing protein [Acetobacteraceae bacterium]
MIGVCQLWQSIKRSAFISASGLLLGLNIAIVGLMELELASIQPEYALLERIRDNTRSLLIGLLNAEVGVRGYIITGDSVYLTPYQAGSLAILNQTNDLRSMPLSASQRHDADQLTSQLDTQLQILAGLINLQRTSGETAAGAELANGQDKTGLDTLRSSISNRIDSASTSMLALQSAGKIYQQIETYCMIFAAFWLYMLIFLSSRRPV